MATRILQVVAIAGDKPSDVLIAQLDQLIDRLRADPDRREWLRSSRVRAAFGEAYRELGAHLKALTWLQRAAKTAYSRLELRHLELGVNSLSRLRPDEMPAKSDAGHTAAAALLKVLSSLDGLDSSGLGLEVESRDEYAASAASERMCLLGSDLVRQASLVLGKSKVDSGKLLYRAARCYTRGYLGKVWRSDLVERQTFALSSALVAGGLAVLVDPKAYRSGVLKVATSRSHLPDWQAVTNALLDEMERARLGATFWHYTNTLDLLLARQVLALALDIDAPGSNDLQRVAELLDRALVRWPAPVEVESMAHRMDLIARVLRLPGVPKGAPKGALGQRHADLLAAVDMAIAKLATYRAGPPTAD